MAVMKDDEDEISDNTIPRWKIHLRKLLDHIYWTLWMTILTIYALFGDDLRMLAFTKKVDDRFNSISILCLFFFALELILGTLCKQEYVLSFYFWLDFIAMVSLIPDIGWIWNPLTGQNDEEGGSAG